MQKSNPLSTAQVHHYLDFGYVVASAGLEEPQLQSMDDELENWINLSRSHKSNFGETIDGKARFDLEIGHTRETPKLRRVSNPADISGAFRDVLWNGPIVDMVAQLIGPDIKFHHSKINIKLPRMETQVFYHQDHSFDPHTNDDMLAILLMLDDADEENGCLRVVPESHKKRYSHFRSGQFVGAIDPSHNEEFNERAVPIVAKRGEVCFMHCWTVHGSEANRSSHIRRLLISEYNATDSYPLLPPALPSKFTGKVIRGTASPIARLRNDVIEMRTPYSEDSFFAVQGQPSAT